MSRGIVKFILIVLICLFIITVQGTELRDQAGYYTIPSISYSFHDGTALSILSFTSSPARLFYTFIKADSDAENKPLFLFFNGGPGSATTAGLLGFYTGHKTLDNRITGGGDRYIDNPCSWTKLGNLLYIDARCAGFSYGILPDGSQRNADDLSAEFTGRNFNSYLDAAEYLRVLLSFLHDHPGIQNNPVVIVGESYGGVRATLMLNMLLHYQDYDNSRSIYRDPTLVDLLQAHYNTVFPDCHDKDVPPEIIAGQFGRQILIQPAIDDYRGVFDGPMLEEPGSLIYQIAAETGTVYTPCDDSYCDPMSNIYDFIENVAGRDIYGCHKPAGWTDSFFDHAAELLLDCEQFEAVTGVAPASIPELLPDTRTRAYKYLHYLPESPAELLEPHRWIYPLLTREQKALVRSRQRYNSGLGKAGDQASLPSLFGPLLDYDAYYSSSTRDGFVAYFYLNAPIARGYASYSYHPLTGQKFLQNLLNVRTFVTNARYDLVVYTNAMPSALGLHDNLVEQSVHRTDLPEGTQRPGQIEIRYQTDVLNQSGNPVRTIRFPYYRYSSHPVSLTEPQALFNDVSVWLEE